MYIYHIYMYIYIIYLSIYLYIYIYRYCCVEFRSHFSNFLFQNGPRHAFKETSVLQCFMSSSCCAVIMWALQSMDSSGPSRNVGLCGQKKSGSCSATLGIRCSLCGFSSDFLEAPGPEVPVKQALLERTLCDLDLFLSQSPFTRKGRSDNLFAAATSKIIRQRDAS